MRADMQHVLRKNQTLRKKALLRECVNRIARCHSGRYGRVTGVKFDAKGRVIFTGHHVDPPGTQYLDGTAKDWRDWNGISWQSVKPKWIT